ncbi:lipid IV(A) 3-deoxy-D-manno-octulosonic acid transferase [Marilutibacter chinensis]|uniref:3-deoxy-D-manno-octulosonic acid transferase n=1 Tax=Marilutibacter chinensis TaxID=2912247 RepID=A0ABS9HY41_9GAMM|nr:lipid IV(A) 3-deoxy-D-manno-octulosonic acid transferase [Lysobacter chinensis]MCF7223260.1 lipid IV(A) 3-deoxy-D-manno-octulosonic acid transferase [Lysobacter chinensis]
MRDVGTLMAASGNMIERLLRGLYSAVLYLLVPVTLYHLIWRGFRHQAYLLRWHERYAVYHDPPAGAELGRRTVWLHAVSVGEVNAAAPVVNALRRARPDLRLLITTITPTGSDRVNALWGGEVEHVYLPYDLPGAVGRFLAHFRPGVALIMETELWPNLLFGSRDRDIPTYILNARLSERSLRGYRVLAPLVSRALRTVSRVAAQSQADADRFIRLGARADQVIRTGNLKFDVPLPDDIGSFAAECRARLGGRPAWIAASTHEDEEAAVLAMHRRLRERHPGLLLIWAPRHPERFRVVAELARMAGMQVATRSRAGWPGADDDVFVVDTLGELIRFYACADIAFVGGSLQPVGGHNLLEPAAAGTAIVTGPHLHNFAEIRRLFTEAGALKIGYDADGIGRALGDLLDSPDERARMVESGLELVDSGRGALAATMVLIEPVLPPVPTAASPRSRTPPPG